MRINDTFLRYLVRQFLLILLAVFLLGGFIPVAEAAWQPELLVGLQKGATSVQLSSDSAIVIRDVTSGKILARKSAGASLPVTLNQGAFLVAGKKLTAGTAGIDFIVEDERQLAAQISRIDGKAYRGAVRLLPVGNGFTIINRVTTEEYLKGVVPEEMPPEWNMEAVKAQAIAARSFALSHRKRHSKDGYDLCATTHCQQYQGVRAERARSSVAIKETHGQVLTFAGRPIEALFHTDSGGMTENSEDVWGSRIPYLRSAKELHVQSYPWDKNISAEQFTAVLAKHGKNIGTLKSLVLPPISFGKTVAGRTSAGRAAQVRFTGTKGIAVVSGNDLRSWLGLKSTLFEMTYKGNVVMIHGYGWGHGLGLSQWGAKALADEKGYKYPAILGHYYQGTDLKKLY
ncbi:MAG: SpoIID/LytB domain-containing protein [Selenomonas sp.]|uniref:SpoIID/LytB domain-containing protein n=1 Tax=Selenomonas sp. TaxID=2053611 RepID=UPI0025F02C55|nr:SpoIID/LytB domain-containing protein [Selenomonas sp.]MCR5440081.1 SpoIID/LytB domain-containing protein [Selenomonas sp.]